MYVVGGRSRTRMSVAIFPSETIILSLTAILKDSKEGRGKLYNSQWDKVEVCWEGHKKSTLVLTLFGNAKTKMEILSNYVAFLKYLNFKQSIKFHFLSFFIDIYITTSPIFDPPSPPNVRFSSSNVQFFGVISDPPIPPKIRQN